MMMQILEAGGMELLVDQVRPADEDNLRGYYEFESVKQLRWNFSWLDRAEGKAVKIICPLIGFLPPTRSYRVIFMNRRMTEIMASQTRMLERAGRRVDPADNAALAAVFERQIHEAQTWLFRQPNIRLLNLHYQEVITNPPDRIRRVNEFLGGRLSAPDMIRAVDPKLYRQRHRPDAGE